ncbi:phytochelatin synthase, partial [Helicosporidium sp. ATCC 50920]
MLDCCRPLSAVRTQGVSLDHAACLARCNGATVELVRPQPAPGGASLEAFREAVLEVCSTPPGAPQSHMILCYSRRALSQSGSGHFSPLGGYSRARDMVLVLDSARFKYPPHWVPLPLMYAALAELNRATGLPRGYLRLGSQPLLQSLLFALDVRDPAQASIARRFIRRDLAQIVARCAAEEGEGV